MIKKLLNFFKKKKEFAVVIYSLPAQVASKPSAPIKCKCGNTKECNDNCKDSHAK